MLGKRLASHVSRVLCEDAFSVGLVANIGRLVVARCIPEKYAMALVDGPWSYAPLERQVLGYTTAEVSAALLQQWGLPSEMCCCRPRTGPPSTPWRGEISDDLGMSLGDVHESLHEAGEQIGEIRHLIAGSLPEGMSPAKLIGQAQVLLEQASR